jgi:hypothetical protein
MANELKMFDACSRFTSSTAVRLTLTLNGSVTLNSSDSAYLTLSASTLYRFPDLRQQVAKHIQNWIYAAMVADAGVTVKPTAASEITVSFTFSASSTPGASVCTLVIGPISGPAEVGGVAAAITAASLDNSANNLWSRLGLMYEDDGTTTRAADTVSAGVATWAGLFQPRQVFIFPRSETDSTGDIDEPIGDRVIQLADGSLSYYSSGYNALTRPYTLVDLDEDQGGRDVEVARCSALQADRITFTIPNPTMLTGDTGLYIQTDQITAGRAIRVGRWWARARSDSATALVLTEEVPSSITVNSGTVLTLISEVHAMLLEARSTGALAIYSVNEETGAVRKVSREYAVENPRFEPGRRDQDNALYSHTLNLRLHQKSPITLVS